MRYIVLVLLILIGLFAMAPGSTAAAAGPTAPSDPTHPVVMQEAARLVATANTGPLQPFTAPPRQPAVGGAGRLSREVFGFGLASSLSDPTFGYPTWDFSLLTTVAFFGLHVQADGSFAPDSGASVWNSSQLTGLLTAAHAHATKVVLTIILQDFASGTPQMCAGLAHVATTVTNTAAEVKAKGVDGVNLDYEGLNGSCGSPTDTSWARHAFTGFVASMRAALPGGSYLSVDTYASSAADPLGFYDVPGLAPSVDSFFVMAYDMEYSNYSRPPTNCATFCLGPTAPLSGYYYNDTSTAQQYTAAVPASKVILGVPYYGRKSCVGGATPNQTPIGPVTADGYLDASTESTDPAPGFLPGSFSAHRDANDPAGDERWDAWYNTVMQCTRELYWDDTAGLGHKYDLVNSDNLRGVGIWTLNYGGGAGELWTLLAAKFATTTAWSSGGGILTSGPGASSWGSTRTDVFVRGTDNSMFENTWNGAGWSGWSSLGGILTSDSGAASWGPNRIDVFVRGSDYQLYHRWWDGSSWSAWQALGGILTSSPAVASWSSGRLDVFVRGTDNQLYHKFWDGQQWSSWEALGGILTSDPAAVSWGPNRIDVFVRGTDNGLWRKSWNGVQWSAWEALGGILTSRPAVASCAPGHVDVFVTGGGQAIYHLGFNGKWGSWVGMGGSWSADPAAVCPPATSAVNLFERGSDGSLWRTSVPAS